MTNELEQAVKRALLATIGHGTGFGTDDVAQRLITNLGAQGVELTLWGESYDSPGICTTQDTDLWHIGPCRYKGDSS